MSASGLTKALEDPKTWQAFAAGISTVALKTLPLLVLFWGWDAAKQQAFVALTASLADVVEKFGIILIGATGFVQGAREFWMPPTGMTLAPTIVPAPASTGNPAAPLP